METYTCEDQYCPDCGKYGNHTCPGKVTIMDRVNDILTMTQDLKDMVSQQYPNEVINLMSEKN